MPYKVGDKVRINILNKELSTVGVIPPMCELDGVVATISEVLDWYSPPHYRLKEVEFYWDDLILEPFLEQELSEGDLCMGSVFFGTSHVKVLCRMIQGKCTALGFNVEAIYPIPVFAETIRVTASNALGVCGEIQGVVWKECAYVPSKPPFVGRLDPDEFERLKGGDKNGI